MKKVLIFALLLSACSPKQSAIVSAPVPPPLPAYLDTSPENLPPISDTSMGTAHVQGAKDDMQYNELKHKYNTLRDLYNCVYTSMKEGKKSDKCL